MHRSSARRDVSPVPDRETRRYGPHKISYKILTELKYWREYYIDQFDICDRPLFRPYKKYLDDESLWEEINTDDEENADEEEIKNEIHVTKIDMKTLNNAFNHHTNEYKCIKKRVVDGKEEPPTLVVRRGQTFSIDMTFDREYDAQKHDLKLQFKTGIDPSPLKGTEITIIVDENSNKFVNSDKWQARVANKMPNIKLEIEVLPPATCVIGEWDFHVYTISKDKRGTSKQLHYKHDEEIIILFNPWCKEDEVYFPVDPAYETDVDPRKEYVLNPVGGVYRTGQKPMIWRYGQFDEDIVQISLMIVRRYFKGIPNEKMGQAVSVTRAISAMVNSNDTNGVLVGKWGKPYDDGQKPWTWIGSTKILKQFKETNKGVKYGQCWVFSAVTVTVCRALGIPCRSITNYSSAHDSNRTNEIEYLLKDDDKMEAMGGDSVWNFHVWNEVWFTRPDLQNHEYDGWQVIDATPQERSEELFQCGPCPLAAVKKGFTGTPYDTAFVFAEANADKVYYKKTAGGGLKRMRTEKYQVGQNITTKKPDGEPLLKGGYYKWTLIDVTHLYKYPDGSAEERKAVSRARRYAGGAIVEEAHEVDIKIRMAKDEFYIGHDVKVLVTVKNTSENKEKTMWIRNLMITMSSPDYTDSIVNKIDRKQEDDVYINPDEEKEFDMTITYDQYHDKIQDNGIIRAAVIVNVGSSGNLFPANVVFALLNPVKIDIEVPETCKVGKEVPVKLTLLNTLPSAIKMLKLDIDDEKFEDHPSAKLNEVLKPNSTWTKTIQMMPIRPGKGQIIASIDTELDWDITGDTNTNNVE